LQAHLSPKVSVLTPKIDITIEAQNATDNGLTWSTYKAPSYQGAYITYQRGSDGPSQVYAWPSKPNGGGPATTPPPEPSAADKIAADKA